MTHQCPISGCDYSAGSVGSVKAHITRKTDENHNGKSGPDFTDEIESGGSVETVSEPEDSPEPAATDGGNAEPVEFPESDREQSSPEQSGQQDSSCPDCGSEKRYDANQYLRRFADRLEGEHKRLLKDSDCVCAECGGVFDLDG